MKIDRSADLARQLSSTQVTRRDWILASRGEEERDLLLRDDDRSVQGANNSPALMIVERAEGVRVHDASGRSYIDLYGNNCHHIGYGHPRLIASLREQLSVATFSPRGMSNRLSIDLAEMLARLWGDQSARIATVPSGSDAIETAVAIAKAATGRHKTISFYDAYHGRSAGALSVGGRYSDRASSGPLLPGSLHVSPFHRHGAQEVDRGIEDWAHISLEFITSVFSYERDIAAFLAEPIRNGAFVPPDWYWPEVRALCDRYGALMIFDEVPTGLGKTGQLFNHRHFDVRPDITVIGKALGGCAIPVAAIIVGGHVAPPSTSNLGYFTHEKNILSARAALATLDIIQEEELIAHVNALSPSIGDKLEAISRQTKRIREVRQSGFMVALEFGWEGLSAHEASQFATIVHRKCLDNGVVPVFPSHASMTLSLPMIISQADIDLALDVVQHAVAGI